jgi:SAM-dependent methyltransferase
MPKVAQFLPDARALRKDKGVALAVFQCSGCGLVQLDSAPAAYYRQVIRSAGISPEMKDFRKKQLGGFIKKFSLKNKKIIEIGCGKGEYLSIAQGLGVNAYGLEYSKGSVAYCRSIGLKVQRGFVQNSAYRLERAPFEAFFTFNFLEHLPEPDVFLRGIYHNLSDDGVGLVEVPNLDMILKKKLFSEFMRDHLLYFSKETLSLSLSLNGFEIIETRVIWHDYIISAAVRKRPRLDMANFSEKQKELKNALDGYIHKFRKVAVWGAGHQALAAISLLGLNRKIEYVIDSAPFKQGKYTPATHIPIVAPAKLDSEPVEAVIIMAASYSDEIARLIRRKFNKNINVAIMRDYGLQCVR